MALVSGELGIKGLHMPRLRALVTDNLLLVVILALFLLVGIKNNDYLTLVSIKNIVAQASVIGLLSLGMTLVIMSGGIDLSVGSVMALTSVATAWTYLVAGWSFPVCVMVGLSVGIVSGLAAATFILYLKLPPFISTLGLLIILSGGARFIGQDNTFSGLPDGFRYLWAAQIVGVPLPFAIFIFAAVVVAFLRSHTPFGRATMAIGSNYRAAVISGVNIKRTLYLCYAISGGLASVAGLLMTSRLNSGQALVGQGYEMYAITAAVVGGASLMGGVGSIKGAVYGAVLISIIYTGVSFFGLSSYYQEILIGIVLVAAVVLNRVKESSRRAKMLTMLMSSTDLENEGEGVE